MHIYLQLLNYWFFLRLLQQEPSNIFELGMIFIWQGREEEGRLQIPRGLGNTNE